PVKLFLLQSYFKFSSPQNAAALRNVAVEEIILRDEGAARDGAEPYEEVADFLLALRRRDEFNRAVFNDLRIEIFGGERGRHTLGKMRLHGLYHRLHRSCVGGKPFGALFNRGDKVGNKFFVFFYYSCLCHH